MMLEQSVTSRSTTVFPLTNTVGADTMLHKVTVLPGNTSLVVVVVVTGQGSFTGELWVPMWPCSCVGVLQCTPQS